MPRLDENIQITIFGASINYSWTKKPLHVHVKIGEKMLTQQQNPKLWNPSVVMMFVCRGAFLIVNNLRGNRIAFIDSIHIKKQISDCFCYD